MKRAVGAVLSTLLLVGILTLTFDVQQSEADSDSQLSLETDKPFYKLGENITITLTNISNESIAWMGSWPVPWQIYTYPENECLFGTLACYCIFFIAPGDNVTYTWNQSDWYTIGPVELGTYEIRDNQGWGLSTFFKIVDEIIVPDDYPTIQEAINNANEGDTVFVRNGTYYEHLVMNKSISLIGENGGNTVIDGSGEYVDVIHVIGANSVEISGFTIRNCSDSYGVYADNSVNCTIKNNSFIDIYYYGICAERAEHCHIEANNFSSSIGEWGRGIYVWGSDNSTIVGNQIMTHNDQCCIRINNSSSCRICENTLINVPNGDGLMIEYSVGCVVEKNIIANCGRGIDIGWWVGGQFAENFIKTNYYGVYAEGSLPQYPGYPKWIFCHNNFLNNTSPYHHAYVSSGNGSWDNGCEGNYWSNYNCTDVNHDGIADVPYVIDPMNQDNYPLMSPYVEGDVNHDALVDIYDVIVVAYAYDSTPLDPNWNPHCDLNEDGMIDIFDLIIVAVNFGEEW